MGVAINPVLRRGQPLIATDYIEWMSQQPNSFFGDIELDSQMHYLNAVSLRQEQVGAK